MTQKVNRQGACEHTVLTEQLRRHIPGACACRQSLPDVEGLSLYLLNPDYPQQELTADQFRAVLNYPAYWAFCWASGQVLARHLLQQPGWVQGRRVLDFGSGSGVAGIAAALAGAREVVACDIDPDALEASRANARLNGVRLAFCGDYFDCEGEFDLVLAADVLYDRENLPWLDRFLERAPEVLLADSRIRDFSHPRYRKLGQWQSSTVPDLDESAEFRTVTIYSTAPRNAQP